MWPEFFAYHNGRFYRLFLCIIPLILFSASSVGCQGSDPLGMLVTPQPTTVTDTSGQSTQPQTAEQTAATAWAAATQAAQPTATPAYAPGQARSNPLPVGSLANVGSWSVQVLDMMRGEAAWQILQETNSFNEPPAAGREYLLVQFWIKNQGDREGSLWLEVTGSRHQLYKHYRAGVVRPQPQLDNRLAAGEESLGWLAFDIGANENNLMLRLEDGIDFQATAVYVALDEGASITRSASLDTITATEWGSTISDPLIPGQIATTANWQVQVREVILGETAYERIIERNRFNDPPEPGSQYGLVYLWLRHTGQGESPAPVMTRRLFQVVESTETVYPLPSLVVPHPELRGDVYPGGELEGWLAIEIPETETAPILRLAFSHGEVRYLSLAAGGR